MQSDSKITRYIPRMHWATRADGDVWFARLLARREAQSAVQCVIVKCATEAMTETVIGTAILFNFEVASGLAEIGYLPGREHWAKGYAFEAMTAFIDLSFLTLDLRRLEATVDVRNVASNA